MRLVLFDCDGTLVDSQAAILAAMADAFQAGGRPAPEASRVRRHVGLSLDRAIAALAPDASPAEIDSLGQAYKTAFHRHRLDRRFESPLYPGIREALATLGEARHLLGVATGKSLRGLKAVIAEHELSGVFVTLQTADRALSKPHPDMVLRALDETGAEAHRTTVIGDTVYDMEMARAAGARALGVAWGYHDPDELLAAGADTVLDHPDQIAERIG